MNERRTNAWKTLFEVALLIAFPVALFLVALAMKAPGFLGTIGLCAACVCVALFGATFIRVLVGYMVRRDERPREPPE